MSNRLPYETRALEVVLRWLEKTRGLPFAVAGEHVPVGDGNCDYVLAPVSGACAAIAVEMVRVVDDEGTMKAQSFRAAFWAALREALGRLGATDVMVETRWNVELNPRQARDRAPEIAGRIMDALAASPDAETVTVEGCLVRRIAGARGVPMAAVGGGGPINNALLTEWLLDTLEEKDEQVAIPDAERLLVAVAWETDLDAEHIVRESARRDDLARLRHSDRVLFIDREDSVEVVYSRRVRAFFESPGVESYPDDERELVDAWLCARLWVGVTSGADGPRNHRDRRVPGPHPMILGRFSARADSAPRPQG